MFPSRTYIFGLIVFSALSLTSAKPFIHPNSCPTLEVKCASADDCCSGPFEFVAVIDGSRPTDKLIYNWTISSGIIVRGQGTSSIRVDSMGLAGGVTTATVEVAGLEPGCGNIVSMTQNICDKPLSRIFDKYGNLSFSKEKARLDVFAEELGANPGAEGYLIAYNHSRKRADRAKEYLVNKHEIDPNRLIILEGGTREDLAIEIYIVSTGAKPPTATPPAPRN